MSGLEIFYVILGIYIVGLGLGIAFAYADVNGLNTSDWVKIIFWPITVTVYCLGLLIWLLIWVPRKLFKGICICFYEIKDFFADVFCDATKDKS